MKKKILSLLCCIALVISAIPMNTQPVFADAGDCLTSADGSVSVQGLLPAGTELVVTPMADPLAPAPEPAKKLMKTAAKSAEAPKAEAQADVNTEADAESADETLEQQVYTYDVKLTVGGEEIQPDGTVRLTFRDVKVYDPGYVEIYHVLDSEEAILAGKGIEVDYAEFVAAFPEEAAIAEAVTGKSGVVYVEMFATFAGTVFFDEEGYVFINASSFSTYYIVSGNSANGETKKDITFIDDSSDDNYYYVAPGTKLTLERENFSILGNSWWRANKNEVNGVKFVTEERTVNTADFREWIGMFPNTREYSRGDHLYVDIDVNAKIGEEYIITSYRGATELSLNHKKTLHFIVMSQEDIVDNIMSNSQYPVYLSVLSNASSGIPGEPGLTNANYLYANSNLTISTTSTAYRASGAGLIDANINDNPAFISAQDGTNTMGIVDMSGTETKAVLSGIDWDAYLDAIAARGTVKASDGTTITNANKGGYEVIPYVVKLQTAYGLGWHIDCFVAPKAAIQISYNANIPAGYIVDNIALPNSVSGVPNPSVEVEIGSLATVVGTSGSDPIALGDKVTATKGTITREMYFRGWTDGSGNTYVPGQTVSFTEDTVLYAIWESTDLSNYTVKHMQEKADGSGYEEADSQILSGVIGESTSAIAKTYPGFTAQSFTQKTVAADDSDNIVIYYNRNINTVTYAYTGTVPAGAPAVPASSTEKYGAIVSTAIAPTLTGYTFSGWTTTDATVSGGTFTMPDADVAFTGSWTPNTDATYTVHYYQTGTTTKLAEDEVRTGLTYNTQYTETAKAITGYTPAAGTQTVVAQYGTELFFYYDIHSWDATAAIAGSDNGFSGTSGTGTYNYNAPVSFTATLKPGYDFLGWYTSNAADAGLVSADLNFGFNMPDNDITYYAKSQEQTVTYQYEAVCRDTVPAGTSFGTVSPASQTVGKVTGRPGATAAAAENFKFVGWYDGNGTLVSIEPTFMPANRDANGLLEGGTFYALFEYNVADYTVKHMQEKADGSGYEEVTADAQTLSGIIGQSTEAAAKTYPGFTAQSFDQKTIAADDSDNIVIYYNRNTHDVTYTYTGVVPAGAPAVPAGSNEKYGATVSTADAPTMPGYTFSGWTTTDATVSDGTFTMPDADVAFTGSWTEQTVTYQYEAACLDTVPAGTSFGSVSTASQTVGKVTGRPGATASAAANFKFVGWSDKNDGTGTIVATDPTFMPANRDANGLLEGGTFYALFTYDEADYTVKHMQEKADGSGYEEVTADAQTLSGIISQSTAAEAKTYPGFTAQPFDQKTVAADESDNIVIYYDRNTHDVTYTYTGTVPAGAPAVPADSTEKYGTSVSTAVAPSLPGYTFSGWTTTDVTVSGGTFTMPDADVAFTGSWTPKDDVSYTVRYLEFGTGTALAADKNVTGQTFNTDVTETAIDIEGFTANVPTSQTVTLDTYGRVILFYYSRNAYPYTIVYKEKGTDNVLKTVDGTAPFGSTVEIPSETFTGFTYDSQDKNNIVIAVDGNEATVLYTRNSYDIKYIVENDVPSADRTDSYLYGADVEPYSVSQTNYDFVGWFTDDTYTTPWTAPATMPASDITVYGKFVRQTASLTLTKTGMAEGESAIFTITGEGLESGLKVAVAGNGGSVTVTGLLVGATYTVTEDTGWSWQYTVSEASQSVDVAVKDANYHVSFSNTAKADIPWLSGEDRKKNLFQKKSSD